MARAGTGVGRPPFCQSLINMINLALNDFISRENLHLASFLAVFPLHEEATG